MAFLPFAIDVVISRERGFGEIDCALPPGPFRCDDGLTETVDYCAAARIGICDLRKVRTRLIVRALSSGGSRHGKTVISAFGASDATSIEVWSGCDGPAELGDGVDAPRRHLCAKVTVSNCHRRRRPWSR